MARRAGPWIRSILQALGLVLVVMAVLAFTRVPFHLHRWLGMAGGPCPERPAVIVVLGGSGMPGGPELLRLHYAAGAARTHPAARLVVVHLRDTAVMGAMVHELVLRGVERQRIDTVLRGTNTREQALAVRSFLPGDGATAMGLVTAPENMYRSLRTFRKAGMVGVGGIPAFDQALFTDLRYGHDRIGGKAWLPDVSGANGLRYNFWNYLKLEITCLREYAAIAYYWMNDWI
jgi:uncharacterized SAM-binding protein YcdF (DUF218 family)